MNIGIIGAGMIGGTLTGLLARAGHQVWVANTRGPNTLHQLVDPLGGAAHATDIPTAAATGDLVIISVPVGAYPTLPADPLTGKIVIDTGNYYPTRDGAIPELDNGTSTSSQLLAAQLPASRVVKMFNTIYYGHLRDQGTPPGTPGRRALPMAGDDPIAKDRVRELVNEIGFDAVDVGPLAGGRGLQPGSPVYNVAHTADELARALNITPPSQTN